MKLLTVAAVVSLATPAFLQGTYSLFYDTFYDNNYSPLSSVVCSTGEYGLITAGYTFIGQLPTFPNVGGAPQIASYDSTECGSCWNLTYTDTNGDSTSLVFTAINVGSNGGYSISQMGLSSLTNGNAQTLDGVSITATQLPKSGCDL